MKFTEANHHSSLKAPSLSVIIPVHNGGSSFRRCLNSLSQATPLPEEIIVVADGDTDGSAQLAQEFGARVIRKPISEGPAKARNLGAKEATGEILYFVDADVEICADAIAQVKQAFTDSRLAALIGSYDDTPGEPNFLSQYKNLFHHYTHQQASLEASTFWGACGAIRRDVFLAVGGFDESYRRPCVEDIELGYRLRSKGYVIRLCKELQVKHLKRWEPVSLLRAEFFYRALPWTALILRLQEAQPDNFQRVMKDLNLKPSSRLSVVLTYLFLAASIGSFWQPLGIVPAATFLLVLVILNLPVYRFFWHKRGLVFTVQTIPWHLFYYFYSGLAFTIGVIRHQLDKARRPGISLADS
ncbi:MAG: glycosyltransferase family 2 protein [Cyanophyceae cyanobacterium]